MTRSFGSLKPGGIFVITSPLNFRIHGYPDDYWRMTPNCLRRLLSPYAARVSGHQGHHAFPHTVMGVGFKAPIPVDCSARVERFVEAYHAWLEQTEATLPIDEKFRRRVSQLYRSKGERRQIADYYSADFTIDRRCGCRRPASEIPRCTRWQPAELDSLGSLLAHSRG